MRFFNRKKMPKEDPPQVQVQERQNYPPPPPQPSYPHTLKHDGSIAIQFALPWDVPISLRDATTGFDAASTHLTDKEIKVLELRAGVIQDLDLYLNYRPVDIDRLGNQLIREQMQRDLYAKIRLAKSRYGRLLDLAVKTVHEYRHHNGDEEDSRKRGFWRRF